MIKNYLKIAFRNLLKYKFTSFINLFGLSIGFTCCLLILIFITNELSFDQYNHNAARIRKAFQDATLAGDAPALRALVAAYPDAPEVQAAQTKVAAAVTALTALEAESKKTDSTYSPLSAVFPKQSTGRRTALAKWMTSRDNPLTARVAANHIWQRHFGRNVPGGKLEHSYIELDLDEFRRSLARAFGSDQA